MKEPLLSDDVRAAIRAALREMKEGRTQAEIGTTLGGISQQLISNALAGRASFHVLSALKEHLELDESALLDRYGPRRVWRTDGGGKSRLTLRAPEPELAHLSMVSLLRATSAFSWDPGLTAEERIKISEEVMKAHARTQAGRLVHPTEDEWTELLTRVQQAFLLRRLARRKAR